MKTQKKWSLPPKEVVFSPKKLKRLARDIKMKDLAEGLKNNPEYKGMSWDQALIKAQLLLA